jgi:hypothetical protein
MIVPENGDFGHESHPFRQFDFQRLIPKVKFDKAGGAR